MTLVKALFIIIFLYEPELQAMYSYVRDSGTGVVPGQHNNLIAIFR